MIPAPVVVIPVHNHGATLPDVVRRALDVHPHVIVVDDGSTDGGPDALSGLPIRLLRLPRNMGKGCAILSGARIARDLGFSHVITLDADGQHLPEDIPILRDALFRHPDAFIVGRRDFDTPNVPRSSRFGRAFSGFWMFIQTGWRVDDMQSGFRAYPLGPLACLDLSESGYAFEIEVLVRAAWAGFAIEETPVRVLYPPRAERISHFHAIHDNLRISLLNTRLTIRALTPIPFRRHALDSAGRLSLLSPMRSLGMLLRRSSPCRLGLSAGVGVLVGALPLPGLQVILLLCGIGALKLDRLCALLVFPLTWPPLVPGMCVMLGQRLLNGTWLTELSFRTLAEQAHLRLLEWVVGGIVAAPALGLSMGVVTWILAACALKMGDVR